MTFVDMTDQLASVLFGLNAALMVSLAVLVGHELLSSPRSSLRSIDWRRFLPQRPELVR